MSDQRGGIISNILVVPIGLVIMAGVFFAGYYTGWTRAKAAPSAEVLPPLPDVVSDQLPKPEEFTFYKTLTDKGNKTVSIKVGPQPSAEKTQPALPAPPAETRKDAKKRDEKITAQRGPETVLKQSPQSGVSVRYTVQMASYPDKGLAEDDMKKLKKKGYAAFVVPFESPGKGTWYRVRLGSFSNRASAEKLMKDVANKEGGAPFITLE
jgi:cell division septation protein DedD